MKKIETIKILIKDHYDKENDLVSRPLVRAYHKMKSDNVNRFINEQGIYLYGYQKDGDVYELFTNKLLDIAIFNYEVVDSGEVLTNVKALTKEEIGQLYALINKFVFGEKIDIKFMEVSTMEEKAKDRACLFDEYNRGLSSFNPYDKEHPSDYDKSLIERFKYR